VISTVSSTLESLGLSVGPVSATGLALPVTGTVAQIESAFDTTISDVHEPSGRIGYVNELAPRISATISSYVQGVVGLDTLVQPQPTNSGPLKAVLPTGEHIVDHQSVDTPTPSTGQPTPTASCGGTFTQLESQYGSHTANQFAQSYDLDPLYAAGAYGSGTTVALAEFGAANYVPSDISTFASCYGISSYQLSEEGDASLGTGDNSDETELDIETVLSLAPAASVEVYQAGTTYDGNGYYALFNKIVGDDSAKIVSVSYGTCEAEEPTSWMNEENTVLQAGALEGLTFFASAGDAGSEACNGGGPNGVDTGNDPIAQVIDPSNGTLYVANKSADDVSVFDESTGNLVGTVSTGSSPDAIVFDGATSQVFVANYGSNSLTEFSTGTCQASNVSGCSSPSTITGSHIDEPSSLYISGPTLYIGNAGNYTVTANSLSGVYDGAAQLAADADPSAIATDSAGEVYVTDSVGQQLYYFDNCSNVATSGCASVSHLNVGNAPDSLLFDPSNGNLYVGNVFDYSSDAAGGIGVINTSTNTESQYIGDGGIGTSSLAMAPSGDLLAGSEYDGTISSISTSTGNLLGAYYLQTGSDTMGQIAVDPTLDYVWLSDESANVDLVEDMNLGVNDPASQPDVTGVGGTSLNGQESAWGGRRRRPVPSL